MKLLFIPVVHEEIPCSSECVLHVFMCMLQRSRLALFLPLQLLLTVCCVTLSLFCIRIRRFELV